MVTESGEGDPKTAKKRLDFLKGVPVLRITEEAVELARALTKDKGALPRKAEADALHIAIATVHNADYLLTWNCRHIDNPSTKPLVRKVCALHGYVCPEICTPLEIMEIN